ncbi:MAG: hypothetical protein NDJ92_18620, partial [Thermoanaerobaculia bacterium]|nr:hypothetical protein [Thermoanaerobaculia bacterium]
VESGGVGGHGRRLSDGTAAVSSGETRAGEVKSLKLEARTMNVESSKDTIFISGFNIHRSSF